MPGGGEQQAAERGYERTIESLKAQLASTSKVASIERPVHRPILNVRLFP